VLPVRALSSEDDAYFLMEDAVIGLSRQGLLPPGAEFLKSSQ
jgi:hypothetical protein